MISGRHWLSIAGIPLTLAVHFLGLPAKVGDGPPDMREVLAAEVIALPQYGSQFAPSTLTLNFLSKIFSHPLIVHDSNT